MKSQSRRRAPDPVPAVIAAAAVLLWLAMIATTPELRLSIWRFAWLLVSCAALTIGWAKVLAHTEQAMVMEKGQIVLRGASGDLLADPQALHGLLSV